MVLGFLLSGIAIAFLSCFVAVAIGFGFLGGLAAYVVGGICGMGFWGLVALPRAITQVPVTA